MKKIIIILILIQSLVKVNAQLKPDSPVPVSPNAASLGLYGQTNTTLYTGSINISVPIYTINLDGKEFPINLSYHSTGTKVAQEASWVGLGWTLNVGGAIVKETKGLDDFKNGGYFWDNNMPWNFISGEGFTVTTQNLENYKMYFSGIKDAEPDIFNFNCGNISGKMFFDKNKASQSDGIIAKPIIHSADYPADISFDVDNKKWIVRDGQGFIYYFRTVEETKSYIQNYPTFKGEISSHFVNSDYTPQTTITSWLLDSIESPKKNKVYFEYKMERIYTPVQMAEEAAILDKVIQAGSGNIKTLISNYSYSYSQINQAVLSNILFKEGKIEFKTSDRSDIELVNMAGENKKPQKLSVLRVQDFSNKIIKQIDFDYYYLSSESYNGRLLLKSIIENNQNTSSKYSFSYNEGYLPPKSSLATDAWGYYNGSSISSDPNVFKAIPTIQKEDGTSLRTGADKAFKEQYASIGMLTSIVYPTGGSSLFIYEPHIISGQEIVSIQNNNAGFIDNYNINTGETMMNKKVIGEPFDIDGDILDMVISAGHDNPFMEGSVGDPSIFYDIELQKWDGVNYNSVVLTPEIKIGKTQPSDLIISLDRIKPLSGRYRLVIRSVRSVEYNIPEVYVWAVLKYKKRINTINNQPGAGLRIARIIEKPDGSKEEIKEYKYSGMTLMSSLDYSRLSIIEKFNPQYPYISTLSYYLCRSYPYTPFASTGKGNIGYSKVTETTGEGATVYNYINEPDRKYNDHLLPGMPTIPNFNNGSISTIEIRDKDDRLVKKEEYYYTMQNQEAIYGVKFFKASLVLEEDLTYLSASYPLEIQNWRKQKKVISTYYNDSNVVNEIFSYTYDSFLQENSVISYNGNGSKINKIIKFPQDYDDALSNNMVRQYMVSTPIESISLVDDKVVSASKIVYQETSNMILPYKTFSFHSNQSSTLNTYSGFYKLEQTFRKYNNKGNLLESVNKDGTYISYLWDNQNIFPIATINNCEYDTVQDSFNQYDMSGLVAPDRAKEDLIRTKLGNSLVTTYTYKPLVGILTATDPSGITTYYDYDSFGRLKETYIYKDNIINAANKQVIQKYDYHYQNQ